ncbi:MAG TPA: aminotransferase class IV [Dysgonamonadaceae bacterium]|nr:aminotransferase class IV [Dysgonamonadaceae bacterium]
MSEQLFIEVIKVENGIFVNPLPHIERIFRTTLHLFDKPLLVELNNDIIPAHLHAVGRVKCRIVYGREIVSIDFEPYKMRNIKSLSLAEHNTIDYKYKYHKRDEINKLRALHSETDDILIIKNSQVTDTSFSNVVFKDHTGKLYTPKSTLLAGTKRGQLLEAGIIQEKEVQVSDINSYMGVYLINAMIDIEDNIFVGVDAIF